MNIKNIFNKLGLSRDNGLFILSEGRWKGLFSKRTEEILENKLKPYAFFSYNNEPFILFFINPENPETLFRQIWNFNQTPIVFVVSDNELGIYNGFSYIKENETLEELADKKSLSDFEYFKIVTGETWENYRNKLASDKRVDEKLLTNIQVLRKKLIAVHKISPEIANYLIGRIIFIRYLIDRNVIIGFNGWDELTNQQLCKILGSKEKTYSLFAYLLNEFNGNLFPISKDEKNQITEDALIEIINLLQGTELETDQLSLFDIYDFSIIPVELISNIYEFFIGEKEQAKRGVKLVGVDLYFTKKWKSWVEKRLQAVNPEKVIKTTPKKSTKSKSGRLI